MGGQREFIKTSEKSVQTAKECVEGMDEFKGAGCRGAMIIFSIANNCVKKLFI